ncbi:MAG TPA: hypothetical protein VJS92_08735, partial [Candidatus Polarisedimenticolaceae bacterium]|nr:hypothetical protein [Candidatus Polarisedimenticolaceae bacterium]
MNCDALAECVSRLLDATLDAAERSAALAHLEACSDCRALHAALAAAEHAAEDVQLSGEILARTSGSAC